MPKSFETPVEQTHQEHLMPAEAKIFDLLVAKHKKDAINMGDFLDLYGETNIKEDGDYVARKRKRIEEAGTGPSKRAEIVEALISEQIELSDWFGPEAATFVPSEFDDLKNGIDIAVEFEREEGFKHLALGVDITSSIEGLTKKILIAKERIREGQLTRIKYFVSDRSHIRGELGKIPLFIIGLSPKVINELSELWLTAHAPRLQKDTTGLSEETIAHQREMARIAQQKLARHRVRELVLDEISNQAQIFRDYALQNNQNVAAEKFQGVLNIIATLNHVELSPEESLENMGDSVNQGLQYLLKNFGELK